MHFIKHRLDQITFPLPAAWPDQRGRPNNAPGVFSRLTFISKQVYELQEEAFVTTSSCVCPQRANCLRGRSPNSAGCELASLESITSHWSLCTRSFPAINARTSFKKILDLSFNLDSIAENISFLINLILHIVIGWFYVGDINLFAHSSSENFR